MGVMNTNDIKKGSVVVIDGDLYKVVDFQHNLQNKVAYVRVKIKNLRTGATNITTFNAGVKIESADVERKNMQYTYSDETFAHFMDVVSYDDVTMPLEDLEWEKRFFVDGLEVVMEFHGEEVLNIVLPDKVVMEVIDAPDAVQGNTATSASKIVTLENDVKCEVPQFIKTGEKLIISTADGKYCSRA